MFASFFKLKRKARQTAIPTEIPSSSLRVQAALFKQSESSNVGASSWCCPLVVPWGYLLDMGGRLTYAMCIHVSCLYTCINTCMHTHTHAYIHACIHTCMHTDMHAYIHACIHTCMHACMHACIHTYIST